MNGTQPLIHMGLVAAMLEVKAVNKAVAGHAFDAFQNGGLLHFPA